MNFSRLIPAAVLLFPIICSAASKEIVELQRDVAQLQDQVRNLQTAFDTRLAQLQLLVQQAADSANRASSSVAGLQGAIQEQLRQQGKDVSGPVANFNTKIEELTNSFQQVQNGIADVTARLGKLEQQMVDLKNAVSTMPSPGAPPPGNSGGTMPVGPPTSSVPPIPATTLYTNANRDRLGGKNDLALQEFNQYLQYYNNTDLAPAAQFWIGNIYFDQGDFEKALNAFDAVLERYSNNNKTPDALYMKGRTLVKLDRRTAGANEFRELIRRYPGSDAATKAKAQLKQLDRK